MNTLYAVIIHRYGEVRERLGERGQSIAAQLQSLAEDALWSWAYQARQLYRKLYRKMDSRLHRVLPALKEEPFRVVPVPYEYILEALTKLDHDVRQSAKGMSYSEGSALLRQGCVNEVLLVQMGLDEATAKRLVRKCGKFTDKAKADHFSAVQLFTEFDSMMLRYYEQFELFRDEMRWWFAERAVDCSNLEPRQKKLDHITKCIQPAENSQAMLMYQ